MKSRFSMRITNRKRHNSQRNADRVLRAHPACSAAWVWNYLRPHSVSRRRASDKPDHGELRGGIRFGPLLRRRGKVLSSCDRRSVSLGQLSISAVHHRVRTELIRARTVGRCQNLRRRDEYPRSRETRRKRCVW